MTQEFKDHIVQHPNRFKRVPVAGTTDQFDLIPTWVENPSEVVQLGTPIDRQLFEGITSQLADMETQKADKTEVNNLANTKADVSYVDTELMTLDTKITSQASGAPKGTYATLSALQSAKPTGDANIYVVTADGKWYYWSGSAWVAGGTYQSTGIADGSITYKKMSNDLTATFEDLSKIGEDLMTPPENVTTTLDTFFDVYTSVVINDGLVSGVKKTSPTAIVGGGLFAETVKEIQFKGMTQERYVVLAFDGTIVYHFNINGGTNLVLRKHNATQTFGAIATYPLPIAVTQNSLVKVVLATSTIDIYVDDVLRLQITNNATTAPYFSNRRLGFLNVPAGNIELNSVSFGFPRTKITDIENDILEIKEKLTPKQEVDLVMFMGQSNMAGRGTAAQAPVVPAGVGYEFRAISDPTKLNNIVEPFGVAENVPGAITEGLKTGSLVSSFAIQYHKITNVPIVGVSASKGGSSIDQWQPGTAYLNDAMNRYSIAKTWLQSNGYVIRRQFAVWLQGETDGENGMTSAEYKTKLDAMVSHMVTQGLETCYVIRIGNHSTDATRLDKIITAQTEFTKTNANAVMASTKLAGMTDKMKDTLHFTQEGLNIVGEDSATNVAYHIRNEKEPTMYDPENANLYYSHK